MYSYELAPKSILLMGYQEAIGELESLTKASLQDIIRFDSVMTGLRAAPVSLQVAYDQYGHPQPHAVTRYKPIEIEDWLNAIRDIVFSKNIGASKINFHLPDEIEFLSRRDLPKGERFMDFVDAIANIVGITSVWENAYVADTKDWSCLENQSYIPSNRRLCLDIGHLILQSKDQNEALGRIDDFLNLHAEKIYHLHLHVNDLIRDLHHCDPELVRTFLGAERFERLIKDRTYIYEKMS